MRAALYVRVSTDRQQQAQTIEQQVAQLQSYVAAHDGWTVAAEHVFRDDGRSGARLDRPGLDALRDHAARAAFDLVVICSPDRLARNFVHQMVVLEELERRGVRVVFCDRPLSDDPHEQLVTQIRGAVAEYERTLIADRMRRGRLAKLRSGQLLPWTRAPYGYRLHPERPRDPAAVQIDSVAAVVVQELFAAYAAGGVTLHALAARLTRRRVPTPTGKPVWRPTTIRNLLTNPAYKGQAASGRLRTHSARRRKSALEPVGRGMSTRAHPPQEWITVPVPALVAAEQFDLVARRLASNQRAARRSTTHPYLLRGLVSCGICRLSCSGVTRTATDTRYRYYRCLGKMAKVSSGRSSCCPARFIPATQLDELVWADLCAVLQHPELVTQALERAHSGAWVPQELRRRQASLRGVRASVARQRRRLLEAYLAEVIDLACFQRRDQGLAGQEADLLAREREVAAQGERLVEVSAIAQSMTQVLKGLRVGLGQASFQQRRQLVELLIDRVVVTDGHVEIRYVIPTTSSSTKTRFCHLRTDYFHPVALAVGGPVEAAPAGLVGLGRDHRPDAAAAAQVAPQAGEAVALVARDRGRADPGPAPRPPDRAGLHERTQHRRLVALPGGGQDHHRLATAFDPKVQLGGVAAAAAAQRLPLPLPVPIALLVRIGGSPPRLAPPGRPQAAAAWPRQRAGGLAPPTRRRNAAASPARPAHPHRPAAPEAPGPIRPGGASGRTGWPPSPRSRTQRAGPARARRCGPATRSLPRSAGGPWAAGPSGGAAAAAAAPAWPTAHRSVLALFAPWPRTLPSRPVNIANTPQCESR
jgi:site-specific DNA recombinase